MRGPERVVDIDVRIRRELRREARVVLLLLGVEAQVLEQQRFAWSQPLDLVLRANPERVAGDRHVLTDEQRQALGHRSKPEAVLDLPVRSAQVAREHDAGAAGQQVADGRNRGANARVVGDLPVLERHVEVDAEEDPLSGGVEVANRELVHEPISPWRRLAPMAYLPKERVG